MANESLKDRINASVKESLKAQQKDRLVTLRMMLAAIKQKEVDERITMSDEQVLAALDKMIKQRRESITQYQSAARQDLADKELAEIAIIQEFMPVALGDAEIDRLVAAAIQEVGAKSMKDMAQVMAVLRPKAQGRADMGAVSAKVKKMLG
ncbi:MAG: GatB/YqeY domain-containing protein [Planctomycetota bacterium]